MKIEPASPQTSRLIIACVLAPLAPLPLLFLIALTSSTPDAVLSTALPVVMLSYAILILAGLPVHLVFYRRRVTRYWSYAVAGAVIGAVLGLLLVSPLIMDAVKTTGLVGTLPGYLFLTLMTAAFCCVSASAFWLIARPDRPPPPDGDAA